MKAKMSKAMKKMYSTFDSNTLFSVQDAVKQISNFKVDRKFVQSVVFDVKFKQTNKKQTLPANYVFNIPHGIQKKIKILAVVSSLDADVIRPKLGKFTDFVTLGDISLVEKMVQNGSSNGFDRVITNSVSLNLFRPLAQRLVAIDQKLLPSKKNGTVVENILDGISDLIGGTKFNVKKRKDNCIRAKFGNLSFSDDQLVSNIMSIYNGIVSVISSPDLIERMVISPAMGPSVKINTKNLVKNI